jgi:hypothetical protein
MTVLSIELFVLDIPTIIVLIFHCYSNLKYGIIKNNLMNKLENMQLDAARTVTGYQINIT